MIASQLRHKQSD